MENAMTAQLAQTTETTNDLIGDKIVSAGFASTAQLLDQNGSLQVPRTWDLPHPWNLPSRLFRFPIEVSKSTDGERRIGVRHPALKQHPFVKHVSETLQVEISDRGAPNPYGYSTCEKAGWWHCVDLMTKTHWKDLLATRHFTTDENIAGAVDFALTYREITVAIARKVMAELKISSPADAATLLCKLQSPSEQNCEGRISWPVNSGRTTRAERAWAKILGLEAGWLKHDSSGHIGWTELGRARYAQGPTAVFVETANGQGAFAF